MVFRVFSRKPYYCDACDAHFYVKEPKRLTSSIYNH